MSRTALVTGAGKRVGRAIALELAAHGHDLAVHYRTSEDAAEEVASECRTHGVDAFTVQGDLADVDDCEHIVAQVQDRWNRLDVLVHNASIYEPCPLDETTLEIWEANQAIHARGPFLLTRGLLPQLLQGEDALVVCMLDIGIDRPRAEYAAYTASKAALRALMTTLAVELAPDVRAIGISPGQVAWPPEYSEEKRDRIRRRIPTRRAGTPEDIATLVRYAAVEGTYLNGVDIPVDGGLSRRY